MSRAVVARHVADLRYEKKVVRVPFVRDRTHNPAQGRPPDVYTWVFELDDLEAPEVERAPRFERCHRGQPVAGTGARRLKLPPEYRAIVVACKERGWTIEHDNAGHYKIRDSLGRVVRKDGGIPLTLPSTPSDWRSLENDLATLRRAGLRV